MPHACGAAVVCGKCSVPIELHPVEACPYIYKPVRWDDRTVGYAMTKKE